MGKKNQKNINTKQLNKQKDKSKRKGSNKKKSKFKKFIKMLFILIILLLIIGAGILAGIFFSDSWGITEEKLALSKINTTIYDKDGNQIATVSGDEKREVVHLSDMPEDLKDAFISIEDETFETHHGVNIKRTIGATVSYALRRGSSSAYGGSTITQQLIKNLMNDKENSGLAGIERKIREISRAFQVEKILSKDQILELYLNVIFMGGDVYGVELGSKYYFNKPCTELDLAESAFLAGINHSPNSYNPYGETDNTEKIAKRTKIVLGKMKELGKITEEEYNSAIEKVNTGFTFEQGASTTANSMSYLAKAALNQVVAEYAAQNDLDPEYAKTSVYGGGYRIYTTQDSNIQSILENLYRDNDYIFSGREKDSNGELLNTHTQSAMIIIDQKNGKVVGCVGGMGDDVNSNGLNRATQSIRQPGSSIKPLASIAPALESGIITASTVYDESSTYFGSYHPTNSGRGLITVRKAIEISANTTEVKIMAELGPKNSIEFMKKMGITSLVTASENSEHNDENLSLALGGLTYGISPLEMAGAYAAIANGGTYIEPTFYTRVEDSASRVILETSQEKTRVMSEGNAYVEQTILRGPASGSEGTATYCDIPGQDTGGKTGTTTDNKDRWFCGFTPYYTAATWFGYDTPEYISSGTNPAARLWAYAMKKIHSDLPNSEFEEPSNVVTAKICRQSGKVATSSCTNTYTEYFVRGTVPDECDGHNVVTICKETGKVANEYCPETEMKSIAYKPEKEDTKLWRTEGASKYSAPTEVCEEHKKEIKVMPNVVGLGKDEATQKLKDLGIKVTVESKEDQAKEGLVLKQSKEEGSEIAEGETVTIVVSKKKVESPKTNTTNTTKTNTTNTTKKDNAANTE